MKNRKIAKTFSKQLKKTVLTTVILMIVSLSPIMAQNNWSFTIRAGADFPTKKMGDATLKTGFGGEGTIAYLILPKVAIYTGWGWNKFGTDKLFGNTNVDIDETGYRFGLQFINPINKSKLKYLIGAGALYNHLEVENLNGDIIDDSGHGWGWQADAGIILLLSNRFNLSPTIRYQSLKRDLKNGNIATSVNLSYVSVGVGLSYLF